MIRIIKPEQPPAILTERGAPSTADHCSSYDAAPITHEPFEFDRTIYGDRSVKGALKSAQHGKCAFCESAVAHVCPGDVEHFRPKGGWRQTQGGQLERPGYFWLAYDWSNLLFCCEICNRRQKGNLFPLADPTQRACRHRRDIEHEQPLFLDPQIDDPEQLIGFRADVPFPIDDDPRARATIHALGLDREELNDMRRRRLKFLSFFKKLAISDDPLAGEARATINDAQAPQAEYAAMARCFFRDQER